MATWEFEPGHTAAYFKVKHMMVTWVRGHFNDIKGTLNYDAENPASASVELTIPTKTLDSGNEHRDKNLKSKDFFDIEKYPTITFKSSKYEPTDDKHGKLTGDLTIRDITKQVVLDVEALGQWDTPFWVGNEDKGPKRRAGFTATTKINRHDFGVSWQSKMDKGGVVVGDDIYIAVDAEALIKD